jgi:diguanylate cyclase (GGDEF)-like protein/PAS domain S-box-containing protein
MEILSLMLQPYGVSESPDKKHLLIREGSNLPLFVLSFLFLTVVLGFYSWQQWQSAQHSYELDLQRTVDHYVKQASLVTSAGLHANKTFTRSYNSLLEAYINQPNLVDEERLWEHYSSAIFNGTGFFITDSSGQVTRHYGPLLSTEETEDIQSHLKNAGLDNAVFSLRYGHQGGYYIGTRFNTASGPLILVSRRAYSSLSDIIYYGGFTGYELVIFDRSKQVISIREQYYADSSNPVALTPKEENQIIYRAAIPHTPWDVLALPVKNYWDEKAVDNLRMPLTFLIVFLIVQLGLWKYLRWQGQELSRLKTARTDTEKRADRALRSIDEALISTDALGQINYLNPRALALLQTDAPESLLGRTLSEVWPEKHALWNRGLEIPELERLAAERRQLHVEIDNEHRIFEQHVHTIHDQQRITGHVWLLRDITDAENANLALEQSRTRYKALFEEAGIAHCLVDLSSFDGTIDSLHLVSVNDATLHLADFASADAMAEHYTKHKAALKPMLDAISTAKDLKLMNHECEVTIPNRSGELREVWVNTSFRSGSSSQVLITMLDITERKRATEKIREREIFWQHVMNAMPDVVYVLNINSQLQQSTVYNNRHINHLLGYPDTPEYKQSSWLDYVLEDDLAKCREGLRHIRNANPGETLEATARFRHLNGDTRVLKFRDTPFVFDDNKVSQYIGTVRDVTEDIEQQEKIVESERRYRLLAENMSDIVWASDSDLNFNFVSTSVMSILGYQPDELIREGLSIVFSRSDIKRISRALHRHIQMALHSPDAARRRKSTIREDVMATAKNGTEIMFELQASLLWNDKGELQGLLGICRDVTEARSIARELQLAAEVFENSNEAILITDQSLKIANTNRAFGHITGYEKDDVIGKMPNFLIDPEQIEEDLIERVGESLIVDGYWQGEVSYRRHNGDMRTGWAGVSAILDNDKEVQSLIIIMSDITERKSTEERIHKLAYYDPLTSLPNRSQMHETLDQMLERARTNDQWVVLLFIDLDRFKPINDSMGHPAGDDVLQQVAGRLRHCVKKKDLVSRMGGDEFTVAIADQTSHASAADTAVIVADRILAALQQSFNLNQREVFITASIGISIFPNDGDSVIELLKNADMAMYHAKDMGRDNMQFFTASMNRKAVQMLELENDLRHALAREEMELYFQPQYQTSTSTMIGAEALLRWNHPTQGMISPGVFIPIIEDTGMIVPIGQWVLEEACQKFVKWRTEGNTTLERIAVNVSARQFRSDGFLNVVKDIIIRTGIRPNQLELELTESILMDDVDLALQTLQGLRSMGVKTAIDDFGTGYSSLNYLKQFPVDTLKIDRSFIMNLPQNSDDAQISRTIIAMGHNLGMGIIAEGVETAEQLSFLKDALCEEVQGFLFSKPVAEQDFLQLGKSIDQSKPS